MIIYTSTKVTPYVYICTNKITEQFYIGYREANKEPSNIDFPKYKTSAPNVRDSFNDFEWYIIAEFFDGDSAYDFEQQLIYENWGNPLLINEVCFHNKVRFKCNGHTQESKDKIVNASKLQWKNMTEENKTKCLKSLDKKNTRWMTKDNEFKMIHNTKIEEYTILGWVIGCESRNTGFTSLKSIKTDEILRVPSNLKEYYLQSGYIHLNSGKGKYNWYTDGITTIRLKISETIPSGFNKGRTF